MNHPNQRRLIASYDKKNHPKPKIEEPDSFLPKKDRSPKTFKMDLYSKTEESLFQNSSWPSPPTFLDLRIVKIILFLKSKKNLEFTLTNF